jgi:protease I
MRLLIAIAPERFRDEELERPMAVFAENGVDYHIASTRTGACTGMLGAAIDATLTFDEASSEDYEGLVIIGGIGSQDFLWTSVRLMTLAQEFFNQGKVVAAICLAPVVLSRAGVLKGKQATVYPSPASLAELKKGGANVLSMPVVADMQVVTANGPGASDEFADMIISKLEC